MSYNDNSPGWVVFVLIAMVIFIFAAVFVYFGVSAHYEKLACENFGGEMTGGMQCVKDNKLYEVVSIDSGLFDLKYKVVAYSGRND